MAPGPPWLAVVSVIAGLLTVVVSAWLGPVAVARIQARQHPLAEPPAPDPDRAVTALDLLGGVLEDMRRRLAAADDHERRISVLEARVLSRDAR